MAGYGVSGRVVVVTGAAGGLGKVLAAELIARGARVALLGRNEAAVATLAAELGAPSIVRSFRADVQDLASLDRAFSAVADDFGGIDVVVANAGVADPTERIADLDPHSWERTVDINLNGTFRTMRAALPHVTARQGYLLAISSMAAFVHAPLQGAYTATKAGVWAFCDTLRLEVAADGVGVGSAHPTFFETPMTDAVTADPAAARLWRQHRPLLWRFAPIDDVVADIIDGIEHRAAHIASPRRNLPGILAAGTLQTIAERIGFPGNAIAEAVTIARRSAITRRNTTRPDQDAQPGITDDPR
ncbi:SDR family NAD(P)-dependent oxidoreductase [Williamsia sterculiae]|uniref:NADP-dependent 3-hydroxy acid dehydrogenase YdfG n=1 Tax=Williamsia sterculiae TaxID=1344003 RepID=A0A1N7HFN4_9NOCA|nr:SDR family NAD(P)-dependent oxidoreductase [Williamsia sterculiae]SIS23470.1 NADP-dependent 3-hydroxy acid dehydrogenase YdfG [Williamsia sterculiae]